MATRACRRAATVRLARERDVAGSHATRGAAGLERRERLGVGAGRSPGTRTVRGIGVGGVRLMRNAECGVRNEACARRARRLASAIEPRLAISHSEFRIPHLFASGLK